MTLRGGPCAPSAFPVQHVLYAFPVQHNLPVSKPEDTFPVSNLSGEQARQQTLSGFLIRANISPPEVVDQELTYKIPRGPRPKIAQKVVCGPFWGPVVDPMAPRRR